MSHVIGGEGVDSMLYSRQSYTLGEDSVIAITKARVLFFGGGAGLGSGVGLEVLKNLLLSGVGSLTLFVGKKLRGCSLQSLEDALDMSGIFYGRCSQIDGVIGECIERLKELNPSADLLECNDPDVNLSQFTTIVSVRYNFDLCLTLNDLCRSAGVPFVAADCRGVGGWVFVDAGQSYEVIDRDGVEPRKYIIIGTGHKGESLIDRQDGSRLELETGDLVTLTEATGSCAIWNGKSLVVAYVNASSLFLSEGDGAALQINNGLITEIKRKVSMSFRSLSEVLRSPHFPLEDAVQSHCQPQCHDAWVGVYSFAERNGRFPKIWDHDEARFVEGESGNQYAAALSLTCAAEFQPLGCMIGAVVSQEVLKCCTRKLTPLNGIGHFEAIDVLHEGWRSSHTSLPQGRVLSPQAEQGLRDLKVFLVGAGALGCELLKNFALLGVGSGNKGCVVVTDPDGIEISNLSRQFLFRREHVGMLKAPVAVSSAKAINPKSNYRVFTHKVGQETENIFNDSFWGKLDCVVTALDNVAARLYVDSLCVTHHKPLFDSGTLGTLAHVQVVIPSQSESYATQRDPPEKAAPMCTIHNFPNTVEHTVTYAKDRFDRFFGEDSISCIANAKSAMEQGPSAEGARKVKRIINELLALRKCTSMKECVLWARGEFQSMFVDDIYQLLKAFPRDKLDHDNTPFWSKGKRCPCALNFNFGDTLHRSFIISAARLRAHTLGACEQFDLETTERWIEDYTPAIANEDPDGKIEDDTAEEEWLASCSALKNLISELGTLRAQSFDKDDTMKGHVDFVTAVANLRSKCYGIGEASVREVRRIAGRITPALITTTSFITGLVCIEIIKYAAKRSADLASFRNAYVNLALPSVLRLCPSPAPILPILVYGVSKKRLPVEKFTLWDRFEVVSRRPLTFRELLSVFEGKYGLKVEALILSGILLFDRGAGLTSFLDLLVSSHLAGFCGEQIKGKKFFDFIVNCESSEEGLVVNDTLPPLRYIERQ